MYCNPSAACWNYSDLPPNPAVELFHRSLPGYSITPLHSLPELAEKLGLGHVLLKDESNRLGLPAFKILGASWASYRLIASKCNLPLTVSLDELGAAAREQGIRLVTCTEGNWGRAIARMAKYLQIPAVIAVPNFMDRATQLLIESEGAKVVVVDGDYDMSITWARNEADKGGLLVMDVSWEGYEEIPEVLTRLYSYQRG
jgi:diaminopropionate ammonia-lyase